MTCNRMYLGQVLQDAQGARVGVGGEHATYGKWDEEIGFTERMMMKLGLEG